MINLWDEAKSIIAEHNSCREDEADDYFVVCNESGVGWQCYWEGVESDCEMDSKGNLFCPECGGVVESLRPKMTQCEDAK